MKKIIFIFLIFCFFNTAFSQSGWQQVTIPNPSSSSIFQSIYFITKDIGLIYYSNYQFPIRTGYTYMTTNGGASFFYTVSCQVSSMALKDAQTGWIAGTVIDMEMGRTYNRMYKTTNGGMSWKDSSEVVTYAKFINSNTGWEIFKTGGLFKTTNAGITFTTIFPSPYDFFTVNPTDTSTGNYRLTQFYFGTGNSLSNYSTNNGVSWNTSNPGFHINSKAHIDFFNGTGFIYGTQLFKTIDYGISWNQIVSSSTILDVSASSSQNVWTVESPGIIKFSSNGGSTFVPQFSGTGAGSTSSIYMFPADSLNHTVGYCNIGTKLYKTGTGGVVTGIGNISNEIPESFSLFQNYPNPFNPTTNIKYDLPTSNLVTLKVYDVNGKKIETLVNENQNAGSYSVLFNAVNYPSGVYFYKLEAGSFSETRKMVLLK